MPIDSSSRAAPKVAGVALIAADTGRVLMLQRGLDDESDPAAGKWELPGGHLESADDSSLHGGMREWSEEVGRRFPKGGTVAHTWTSPNGVYQGHVVVIDREDQVNLSGRRVVDNTDDDYSEQAAWWTVSDARSSPALRRECRTMPWDELERIARAAHRSATRKDVYAAMAPASFTRQLGSTRHDPVVPRRHGPSLRGQVARLKRRSRKGEGKVLVECRSRLSSGIDPELKEIIAIASASASDSTLSNAWARLESKGAPSRMPPQLMRYWARGPGLARWSTSPTPYRTLRRLLRRYGVGGMSVDGATANVFRNATGIYPGQRPNGGRKG